MYQIKNYFILYLLFFENYFKIFETIFTKVMCCSIKFNSKPFIFVTGKKMYNKDESFLVAFLS